ncbi:hypothetical protein [Halomarina pelagica]|uniref:hypothetical protein n=1 Tax=Halomarina pelagica TaxID=2961599 RepID=UPI0020C1E960|nr:hypothetical protein [Halomarina sp. BND7]
MYRDDRPPLPDWILTIYRTLSARIQREEGGLSRETATDVIVAEGIEAVDAEYALQRLIDRGYLYMVDEELFVTEPAAAEE